MRRLCVLLALTGLLFWLVESDDNTSSSLTSVAVAQEVCCPDGQKSPHLACVDGTCQSVNECGVDDCTACTGCDPDGSREAACIAMGWEWDPVNCICMPPHCDPGTRNDCLNRGGSWDEN
ncbi:MAG TPA: hypothetical protein VFV34_28670, partial [Blastocatellia bacterium]|nr:hypothetical protein [Blastocatellia bacterium]